MPDTLDRYPLRTLSHRQTADKSLMTVDQPEAGPSRSQSRLGYTPESRTKKKRLSDGNVDVAEEGASLLGSGVSEEDEEYMNALDVSCVMVISSSSSARRRITLDLLGSRKPPLDLEPYLSRILVSGMHMCSTLIT
jgi:hypothetical protein